MLLHANDLLDQKLLENGSFTPVESLDSVRRVIVEIVEIISMTIDERDVKIYLNFDSV